MSETLSDYEDYKPRPPRVGTEIDFRVSNGLEVTLYWDGESNEVWVGVIDFNSCETFIVPIPEGIKPSEVFKHPYAYKS